MDKAANRKGLNTRLYKYSDKSLFMNIDFANVSTVEATADRKFATGGQAQGNMVGFDDPMTGTLKISTQIIPIELIALAATGEGVTSGAEMAVREEITVTVADTVTLTSTPIAGTIYIYEKASDLTGTPAATTVTGSAATITGAAVGDIYVAYYMKQEATAKSVIFGDNTTPASYIIYSDTVYKCEDDTVIAEQIHAYKAMPKKAISLNYQGTGDPMSLDITFDLMADTDGNVIQFTRK